MVEDYSKLLPLVARVGLHPDRWPEVLDALATASGSRGVAVIPLQVGGRLQNTASLDALADRYVETGWVARDLRNRAIPKMLGGHVAVDADVISWDEMRREPYYQDFLGPLGFRHFAGFITGGSDSSWAVTLQRGVVDDAFSAEEQRALGRLIQPFADAVKIGHELGAAYHKGALDQIGRAGTGCILVDRDGRALHLNQAAEAMVGHVFDLRRGTIYLSDVRATHALHDRIRATLQPVPGAAEALLATCVEPAHLFEVMRLPDLDTSAFAQFRSVVLIRDLARPVAVEPGLLQSAFGLTPREGQLANALCRSSGLVEAAAKVGIRHETARSQLKSIFAKTGTISQNQLIGLLGQLGSAAG